MTEKKNGRPTQPGSHSVSYQHRRRKPTPILHRLAAKCKSLNWRWILPAVLALLALFSFVCYATGISRQQAEGEAQTTTTEAPEPTPEPKQPPAYVFIYGEGCPVNMQAMTDAWAAEAGFEKRYIITDEERYELASAITAEAIGEPFAGKVAVAQCILQACEDDGIRPIEALTRYKYSTRRPEPTDEALAAMAAPAAQEEPQAPAVTLDELEGMDDALWTQDEAEDAPRPAWRITDDGCADWACRKIAEEKAELDRIRELADAQIQKIEEKVAAAERRFQNGTRFLTGKLAEYFETVPHKTTKTKASYRLLSGTLTRKFGGTTMKQDDEKLVQFLKDSGQLEFIKTEEKPRWGDFKKRLEIIGGSVVDKETGEIVEAVQIIEKPDTFTVDV